MNGYIQVIISALGFGAMGLIAKFAYSMGINVNTLLVLRFGIAAIIFWTIQKRKTINVKVNRQSFLLLILLGVFGYAVMALCLFSSFRYLPTSIAVLVFYTYPLLVLIISRILGIEKLSFHKYVSLIIGVIGLFYVLKADSNLNSLGVIYAVLSAVVYSLFILISNQKLKEIHSIVSSAYITTAACITLIFIGLWNQQLQGSFAWEGWGLLFAIAIVSTVIPILFFFEGLKKIGPTSAAILSMMEPVFAILLSTTILHENMNLYQWVGMVLVLISSGLVSIGERLEFQNERYKHER